MLGNVSLPLRQRSELNLTPLTDMQSSSSRFVANIVPLQNVQTSVTGKNELQTLQTTITALQTTVTALQGTVTALQATVSSQQISIAALQTQVSLLQARLA